MPSDEALKAAREIENKARISLHTSSVEQMAEIIDRHMKRPDLAALLVEAADLIRDWVAVDDDGLEARLRKAAEDAP